MGLGGELASLTKGDVCLFRCEYTSIVRVRALALPGLQPISTCLLLPGRDLFHVEVYQWSDSCLRSAIRVKMVYQTSTSSVR
jgi:hypothetical protein